MMGKHLCMAHCSFCTYFRNASWYQVVLEVLYSVLIAVALSHFLHDRSIQKESRMCAELRSIPIVGVLSEQYWDSFCRMIVTAKYKSFFQWVSLLAEARITRSIWRNMSFNTVITWCRVTVSLFDMWMVQYWNGDKTSVTSLMMLHSSWVVKSGWLSSYVGFLRPSWVNSGIG